MALFVSMTFEYGSERAYNSTVLDRKMPKTYQEVRALEKEFCDNIKRENPDYRIGYVVILNMVELPE